MLPDSRENEPLSKRPPIPSKSGDKISTIHGKPQHFRQSLRRYSRSASRKARCLPLALSIPALRASIFPLFLSSLTRTRGAPRDLAAARAASEVPSKLPSSTITIS